MAWPATRAAVGDLITVANLNALPVKLAEYWAPLSGDPANIDFQSIPSVYAHLMFVCVTRDNYVGVADHLAMRFNNDSAGNYDYIENRGIATTPSSGEGYAETMGRIAINTGGGGGANMLSVCQIDVPHYANTANHKEAHSMYGMQYGTPTLQTWSGQQGIYWRSTSAINRVTFITNLGTAFKAGQTRITMYGLPG